MFIGCLPMKNLKENAAQNGEFLFGINSFLKSNNKIEFLTDKKLYELQFCSFLRNLRYFDNISHAIFVKRETFFGPNTKTTIFFSSNLTLSVRMLTVLLASAWQSLRASICAAILRISSSLSARPLCSPANLKRPVLVLSFHYSICSGLQTFRENKLKQKPNKIFSAFSSQLELLLTRPLAGQGGF
jgi:hypothetical protein